MKTLGLIGGTTWISTIDYYRYINRLTSERLGGDHSAKMLLYSVDFNGIKTAADAGNWETFSNTFADIAVLLEKAGSDAIVLCANTAHIAADHITARVKIPLIHIADSTAAEISKQGLKKVILLGTNFTMTSDFYTKSLARYGIEALIPDAEERAFIHNSIFDELGKEIYTAETKQRYLAIIDRLSRLGAEGVIFGCTEIPLLLKPEDCSIPSFDTTLIHATFAVHFALS
jgi:aspartate racemase